MGQRGQRGGHPLGEGITRERAGGSWGGFQGWDGNPGGELETLCIWLLLVMGSGGRRQGRER